MKKRRSMKIGIISSEGGHLVEALNLIDAFKEHELFLVTYKVFHVEKFSDKRIKRIYYVRMGATNLVLFFNMILNSIKFFHIFLKERPAVLYSTGSEIAFPAFYIGKFFFGTKLVFVETITKVKEPSKTGRVVYPITDLFIVPWKELKDVYGKKAQYAGRVI